MDRFDIQKLRALPIEGVAQRLGLQESRHKSLCPFHSDSHPSLTFNVAKNTFRCFACGAHGGVIDLAMHVLGKSFIETCEWLANEHNVILTEWKPADKPAEPKPFDAARYSRFFEHPSLNEPARAFLFDERKLNEKVISWCRLTSFTDRHGIPWLQIPYFDIDGKLIGVQNRNLSYGKPPISHQQSVISNQSSVINHQSSAMSADSTIQIHKASKQQLEVYTQDTIQSRIMTIRGHQVIMDADLAEFYQVKTIALNQAVKRNEARFPLRYRFQLTEDEKQELITNCDRFKSLKHSSYLPYAFTEQGVTQLSAVLRSNIAVEMSIRINDAFHAMRKFIVNNAGIFQRLEAVELKQISTDKKINQILDRLDDGTLKQKLGIFFDGQMFDAFVLVEELILKATKRIILIDDYITASLLQRFHKRSPGVTLDCYVKARCATPDLKEAIAQYNAQYPNEPTILHTFEKSHDRWLIIDDTVYHFGASLKDLGKRWFSVSVISEHTADELISRL